MTSFEEHLEIVQYCESNGNNNQETQGRREINATYFGNRQKAYLRSILDFEDNSIVASIMNLSNNNMQVFETLKAAIQSNLLFPSDRGFQYTSYSFAKMLEAQGMGQRSRLSCCIYNGHMKAFWGQEEAERYNLEKHYLSYQD